MHTTDWVEFANGTQRIRAVYGLHAIGSQKPYFSITGELQTREKIISRWREDSFGCLHESIMAAMPDLMPLIPFHLFSEDGPMHYLANASYWHDIANFRTKPYQADPLPAKAFENFKSLVLWGILSDDTDEVFEDMKHAKGYIVENWLKERLPKLQVLFNETMELFNVH